MRGNSKRSRSGCYKKDVRLSISGDSDPGDLAAIIDAVGATIRSPQHSQVCHPALLVQEGVGFVAVCAGIAYYLTDVADIRRRTFFAP